MYGFLLRAEGTGAIVGDNYVAYNDTTGHLTVGMGITWANHMSQFNSYGITTMSAGDLVNRSIVDAITEQDINGRLDRINDLLNRNNISGLTDYQMAALLSRAYNLGNVNSFPGAFKQYGMTQDLYTYYFSTGTTSKGVELQGLIDRRAAEWELFTTGNWDVQIYGR